MERIADRSVMIRYAKIGGAVFLALFLIQSLYQALKGGSEGNTPQNQGIFEASRKNYATYSKTGMAKEPALHEKGGPGAEKYEKIARLGSRTSSFDSDRKQLLDTLSAQKAVIQFESLQGLAGARTYYLSAGVPPEIFDSVVEQIRAIGRASSLSIEKTDKTSEYRALLEKRASLERTRASLAGLKAKGGTMDEFLKLENRLLEIEEQLRETGLSIGQFNAENEFCTVQFTLREKEGWNWRKAGHLVVDSFIWTLALSAMLAFLGGLAFAALWMMLSLRNRLGRRDLRPPGQG